MNLRESIFALGGDLNITNLQIDKNYDLRGRPATLVEFDMDAADGRRGFEMAITNDLEMQPSAKAALIIANARHQANKELHTTEVEL